MDWNHPFNDSERADLESQYDAFVTTPGSAITLLRSLFKVPYEKIIGIAHGRYDLEYGISQGNEFDQLKNFAGVSPDLYAYARELGINRPMEILRNGLHFDYFYQHPAEGLRVLGYSGAFRYENFNKDTDIKRGFLVKQVAERVGIPFKPAPPQTYLTMPQYYSQVDTVLVSSLEESCGLPLMEAAASGRVPMSTPVGIARDDKNYPGIVLPFDEGEYVEQAIEQILYYSRSPNAFRADCKKVQEYAKENYDWPKVIDQWLNVLT